VSHSPGCFEAAANISSSASTDFLLPHEASKAIQEMASSFRMIFQIGFCIRGNG